jgi:hypothetical protein
MLRRNMEQGLGLGNATEGGDAAEGAARLPPPCPQRMRARMLSRTTN